MESPAHLIAAGRLKMTLCSYEYQSEIRYDYRVLHAQIGLMERGLEFQQDQQRQLYKGGVHFCPHCAGQELRNLGQFEEAGWLLDRSAILRTDTNEKVMDVLHRFNLYSDGDAAPRLKMLFECQARPSERYPKGRNARYAHLKGRGTTAIAQNMKSSFAALGPLS